MSNDAQIPLLQDLLYRGHIDVEKNEESHSTDEHTDVEIENFEIEQDETNNEPSDHQQPLPEEIVEQLEEQLPDEITADNPDLNLEKEIRLILDKQMDKAYKKIIRLLNERKS